MRRLAVVGAVTVAIFTAFVAIDKNSGASAAGRQIGSGPASPATASIASAGKVSVVASNVAARALAVNPASPNAPIDLTNASAPNQIFTLGSLVSPALPSANARIAAVAGTGSAGSLGDGGLASAAQFDLNAASLFERSGIAIAPDGTLYVADTGNATIRAVTGPSSSEPGVVRSAAGRWASRQSIALAEPMGIALDRAGNLYIADHGAGAVDEMVAGGGQLQTLAQVACAADIAVSANGETVFVTSPEKGAVFAINTQTHALQTVSALGAAPPSTGSGCIAPPLSGSSVIPAGIAVDAAGNLFISDLNNGRILKVDAKTSAATVIASGLNQPGALAFDGSGNLVAAEQGLARIVAFAQGGTSQGSISLLPNLATLSSTPTGGTSAAQTFTLSNTTAAAVTGVNIPKATTPADFAVLSTNCTTTLPANSSCTLSVAFTPTASGARSATLTVTDSNASDSASTVLNGTGDDYEVQLGAGQLMSVSVLAGNAVTMNLQVVPDSVFSGVVTLACPNNLPTNTTCTFSAPTVNVSAGTPAPFQVTFQTTGLVNPINTMVPRFPANWPRNPGFPALGIGALLALLFAMLCLALLWMLRRRSLSEAAVVNVAASHHTLYPSLHPSLYCSPYLYLWLRRALPAFALLALAVAILAGCKKSTVVLGSTPTGPTNMVITGNAQNASRGLSITLNVVSL